jgi:hypothetical protein
MIGGTLLSLIVGYIFHRCFERPFMTTETWASISGRGRGRAPA